MIEDDQSRSLFEPGSPKDQVALALEAAKALSLYARAEHLAEADELLAEVIALLMIRNSATSRTE